MSTTLTAPSYGHADASCAITFRAVSQTDVDTMYEKVDTIAVLPEFASGVLCVDERNYKNYVMYFVMIPVSEEDHLLFINKTIPAILGRKPTSFSFYLEDNVVNGGFQSYLNGIYASHQIVRYWKPSFFPELHSFRKRVNWYNCAK